MVSIRCVRISDDRKNPLFAVRGASNCFADFIFLLIRKTFEESSLFEFPPNLMHVTRAAKWDNRKSCLIAIALEIKDMEGSRQPVPPLKAVKASYAPYLASLAITSSSEAPGLFKISPGFEIDQILTPADLSS